MASYIEGALMADEKVVYQGHISLWSMWHLIALGIVLFPLFWLFWGIAYVRYKATELAVTNKRVIAKFGFISRRTIELSLNRIEGVEVTQSVWGRVFNYGSLLMSGTGSIKEPIDGISHPLEFRRAFMSALDSRG